jgi:hypothetical protein
MQNKSPAIRGAFVLHLKSPRNLGVVTSEAMSGWF